MRQPISHYMSMIIKGSFPMFGRELWTIEKFIRLISQMQSTAGNMIMQVLYVDELANWWCKSEADQLVDDLD